MYLYIERGTHVDMSLLEVFIGADISVHLGISHCIHICVHLYVCFAAIRMCRYVFSIYIYIYTRLCRGGVAMYAG